MVQFGIWEFDENFGLIGKPENLPEVSLSFSHLWDIEVNKQDQVWKWPIYLAKNSWFTPKVADDFNKAGTWSVGAGVHHVDPDAERGTSISGSTRASVSGEYFFRDNWGVALDLTRLFTKGARARTAPTLEEAAERVVQGRDQQSDLVASRRRRT